MVLFIGRKKNKRLLKYVKEKIYNEIQIKKENEIYNSLVQT